jgi:Spy/CpxP family protein refolding chaperone
MEDNTLSHYSAKRFLLVVGAVLFATVFVYCKPWKNKSPEERAEAITKRITKELDLTSVQIVTLTKIKDEMLAKHKADKPERDAQFKTLTELVRSESIDRAKLSELKKRHVAMRDRAEELFLDKVIELHKILTPEQRAKAADALLKYEKKFSGEK